MSLSHNSHLRFAPDITIEQLEENARQIGVRLSVTQIAPGRAHIGMGFRLLDNSALAAYQTTHSLGFVWQARPNSIGFSLQVGAAGLAVEGKPRTPYSIITYVGRAQAGWAGVIRGTNEVSGEVRPAYHISIPIEAASILGISREMLNAGWMEAPLDPRDGEAFANWADDLLNASPAQHSAQDDMFAWLLRFMGPTLKERRWQSISHYCQIIHQVIDMSEQVTHQSIPVATMAHELGVSVRTIQRAFKTVFGIGVSQFLRNRRLRKAHEMLLSGSVSVYRAAHETGFHHAPRFSQMYRRFFGCVPSDTMPPLHRIDSA